MTRRDQARSERAPVENQNLHVQQVYESRRKLTVAQTKAAIQPKMVHPKNKQSQKWVKPAVIPTARDETLKLLDDYAPLAA